MKNILILMTLLFLSCSDNITPEPPEPTGPTLPAITTEGLNTFGCLKDGEIWLPIGYYNILTPNPDASYNEAGDFLNVYISQNLNNKSIERFNLASVLNGQGSFNFFQNIDNSNYIYIDSRSDSLNSYIYYLDSSYSNKIEILKLDTINDFISGTFEVRTINEEIMDTILFSEGRFDLNYTY